MYVCHAEMNAIMNKISANVDGKYSNVIPIPYMRIMGTILYIKVVKKIMFVLMVVY